jgi:two-component system, cell cycle response regulator
MTDIVRLRDVSAEMATLRDMRSFNAVVTHKLRTPIGHVVGNLELLARYYREQVAVPEVAALFEDALKGGKRLSQEVDDILRYLHDAPALAVAGDAFALAQLPLTVKLMNLELELAAITVSIDACPPNARVALAERAMELVLWEVLENAKKFHPAARP